MRYAGIIAFIFIAVAVIASGQRGAVGSSPSLSVRDFGAIPDDGIDDHAAIRRAIDSSRPGQRVTFEPGTYDLAGVVTLRSGREYVGDATVLLAKDLEFSVKLEPNAADLELRGIRFEGAGLAGGDGSRIRNVRIIGNQFHNIPSNAIKFTVATERVVIEHNTFDNVRGYGAVLAYNVDRFSFSHNRMIDVTHGGHVLGPLEDCRFVGNYMTGVEVMGLEIQRDPSGRSVSRNLLVEDNVIYDWKRPNGGSFGLSVIAEGGVNTIIRNNYIRGSIADGSDWNPDLRGQGRTFGPAIEAGFDSGVVEGNVIGGPFHHYVACAGVKMPVRDNRFYGTPTKGGRAYVVGWPSIHGFGCFVERNNVRDSDLAKMPAPPQRGQIKDEPDR